MAEPIIELGGNTEIDEDSNGNLVLRHVSSGETITLDSTGANTNAHSTDQEVANPAHYDYAGEDAPINIGVDANSRAINIQSQTDTQASGAFGNIYWISDAGERYATIVGNSNSGDRDIAIYTKGDSFGSGDTSLNNRFQIKAGADQTHADFFNLNVLSLNGDQPDLEFEPETQADTRLWFNDATNGRQFVIRRVDSDNTLRLTTLTGSGDSITINPDASVSFNSNLLKDPATEGSSTDPRADTTADDWLHIEIGGTLHYVPLYT